MTEFDRRRTPARDDLAAAHLENIVAAPRYVEGRRMRVIDEAIPLRAQPSRDCSLDTQALHGEEVVVYDIEEGWAWGQLARDGYVGYMPSDSLSHGAGAPTHRVVVPRTFLYPDANMKLPDLGALPLGADVEARAARGDFFQLANGAFVFAAHLQDSAAAQPDFVSVAESYVGAPYLWGGKTYLGLDCSGLVQIALQASNRTAPRDTDMQQAELGAAINDGAPLARGDLVFWKGHVAIMLDATRMIHASGHHMQVVVEDHARARQRILETSQGDVVAIRRLIA